MLVFFLSSSFLFYPLLLGIIFVFASPYLSLPSLFFLFPNLSFVGLSFTPSLCPSLSLLDTTTHRLDLLMMRLYLELPQLHIHRNIYHIIIYLLGCFTYLRISKSSPVFAFSFFSLFFGSCILLIEKKCADLFYC